MRILIEGSGAREHAIARKLREQHPEAEIHAAPGNPGIALLGGTCYPEIKATDIEQIVGLALKIRPDLNIVGPEAPLALGLVDRLEAEGIPTFGPNKEAAQAETSKVWSAKFRKEGGIPSALFTEWDNPAHAKDSIITSNYYPVVVKVDGLAGGKGVRVCHNEEDACQAVDDFMVGKIFGAAGDKILLEQFLTGPECSVFAFCDGKGHFAYTPPVRDYKLRFNRNEGKNTGGMGGIYPIPEDTPELRKAIEEQIIAPTFDQFVKKGITYKGILYFGLVLTPRGPKVIEYNARFGDPEALIVLPMIAEDVFDLMMQTNTGIPESRLIKWAEGACATVVAVHEGYPDSTSEGKVITGLEEAEKKGGLVFQAGTAFGTDEQEGEIVTHGGRIYGVTGRGDHLRDALHTAYVAIECTDFTEMDYRTDIGAEAL